MADSDIHKRLFDASYYGKDTQVRELLAAGADPDKYKKKSIPPWMLEPVRTPISEMKENTIQDK